MRLRNVLFASLVLVGCSREDRTRRDDHPPPPAQQLPSPSNAAPGAETVPAPPPEQPAQPRTVLPPEDTASLPAPPVEATPPEYDDPVVDTVTEPVVGEPVANIDVFFDQF